MHVGLFDTQHDLPSYGDTIEEVVDETHVVYEGVNVTGAQHQQSGDQLFAVREEKAVISAPGRLKAGFCRAFVGTHSENQGRNRSATFHVDHGQQTWEMAFPRPSETQPERQKQRQVSAESGSSCWLRTHT